MVALTAKQAHGKVMLLASLGGEAGVGGFIRQLERFGRNCFQVARRWEEAVLVQEAQGRHPAPMLQDWYGASRGPISFSACIVLRTGGPVEPHPE